MSQSVFCETCVSTNILLFLSYWKINFIAREWENESANIHSVWSSNLSGLKLMLHGKQNQRLVWRKNYILFLKTFFKCRIDLHLCRGKIIGLISNISHNSFSVQYHTSSIFIFNHEDLYLIELLHHSFHILNAFNKESLKLLLIDTWSHFEKFFFPFVTTTISIELSFYIYLALNKFFP